MSVLDDVNLALRKIDEAKRIVICHPDNANAIREMLSDHEFGHLIEVAESPALADPGTVYVIPKIRPLVIPEFGGPS